MQTAASAIPPRLVVIGGNGYLGSAICKAAIGKGWTVDSVSSSGKPSVTPAGHARKWSLSPSMRWNKGDVFDPSSYAHLLGPLANASSSTSSSPVAVVHTLGILLETDYKPYIRSGDVIGLAKAVLGGGDQANPLKTRRRGKEVSKSYDAMNRDSAITVLRTLLASRPSTTPSPTPFVYISAEDTFPPPLVPRRYIETKREADREIVRMCAQEGVHGDADEAAKEVIRPVLVRPGLMYHPHIRPLSTPLAVALDITSTLHRRFSPHLPASLQTPAVPTGSTLDSVRRSLQIPPIHVDHVVSAVLRCIEDESVRGVVDTRMMRRMVGWDDEAGEAIYEEAERPVGVH